MCLAADPPNGSAPAPDGGGSHGSAPAPNSGGTTLLLSRRWQESACGRVSALCTRIPRLPLTLCSSLFLVRINGRRAAVSVLGSTIWTTRTVSFPASWALRKPRTPHEVNSCCINAVSKTNQALGPGKRGYGSNDRTHPCPSGPIGSATLPKTAQPPARARPHRVRCVSQCHRAAGSVQLVRVCQTLGAAADPAAQLRGSRPSSVEDAEHDRRSGSTQCRWCPMCTSDEPRTRVEVTARLAQSRTRAAMQGPPGSSLRLSQYVFNDPYQVSKGSKGFECPKLQRFSRQDQMLPPR